MYFPSQHASGHALPPHDEHAHVVNYTTHPTPSLNKSLLYVSVLQAKPQHLATMHSIWLLRAEHVSNAGFKKVYPPCIMVGGFQAAHAFRRGHDSI